MPKTDVFHFYFGWTLVPRKATWPILKATRRKSVLHFLGSDIRGKAPDELRYARGADARIVGSYDALRWVPDAEVIPPGLDLRQYDATHPEERARPIVLHAPSSRRRKGTEHVVEACEGLDVDLDIVEGLRHDEARRRYGRADIVVDQLNAGWYGIFALEAMALGKPVLSYLRPEAVQETQRALGVEVPIVHVTTETLRDRIAELADAGRNARWVPLPASTSSVSTTRTKAPTAWSSSTLALGRQHVRRLPCDRRGERPIRGRIVRVLPSRADHRAAPRVLDVLDGLARRRARDQAVRLAADRRRPDRAFVRTVRRRASSHSAREPEHGRAVRQLDRHAPSVTAGRVNDSVFA